MPSMYAHQRFGEIVRDRLPASVREQIRPYQELYEIGLQGPDIFFYYDPIRWGEIPQYGNRLHEQTGRTFFTAAWNGYLAYGTDRETSARVRMYLYGLLCHYSLDSTCHPYIEAVAASGVTTHAALEGDYDRHLIALEGRDPVKEDVSRAIHPSKETAGTIAAVYPKADEAQVLRSLRMCVAFQRLLRCPHDFKRDIICRALRIIGKYESLRPHIMNREPDPACQDAELHLDGLMREAASKAVRMITELDDVITAAPPDGSTGSRIAALMEGADYDPDFSGALRQTGPPA